MSRFKEYITEDIDISQDFFDIFEFIEEVKKDCKPWLQAIKSCSKPVAYRGLPVLQFPMKHIFYDKPVRTDRRPLDMLKQKHEMLDKAFYELFGWWARSNAVFLTGDITQAADYGREYLVFPLGKFKFVWSPKIDDMVHLPTRGRTDTLEDVIKLLKEFKFTDKGLCAALQSENEIMVNCKKYHAISSQRIYEFTKMSSFFGGDQAFIRKYLLK
jgi:hypothetical protein